MGGGVAVQVFVNAWSKQYDFDRYPIEFYYQCIEQIRISDKPIEFARYVMAMLHWKDGKVAKNPKGNFTIGGVRYSFGKPKPYIYNSKIQSIIESKGFFEWGKRFGNQSKFVASEVRSLTEAPFSLWSNNVVDNRHSP